ncbi:MAG: hypothetical protein IIX44_02135 [Clostridia bacterium]|nr:hypothetical protein [Clostridia bacterium]
MIPNVCELEKSEIVDLLLREEYGYLPEAPNSVHAELVTRDKGFCAGKADLEVYNLVCECSFGRFSFPIRVVIPKKNRPVPAFVHINFRPDVPDKYQPTEEIIDAGYAVLSFCYKEVTSDDGDFTNGLAGLVYKDGKRAPDSCGKLGLWAWAAMRVLDYTLTLDSIDPSRISVTGHSRLGKTALLAGMLDERFYCAFSNDSGCSGASIARDNDGETVKKIVDRFPYWFCENYYKYADNEEAMPFDQHFLVAANYPHRVYVASAEEDAWACPKNEFLSCTLASDFYKKHGGKGFPADSMPECGKPITGGDIGYHIRKGSHYQSREDWNYYIKFLES